MNTSTTNRFAAAVLSCLIGGTATAQTAPGAADKPAADPAAALMAQRNQVRLQSFQASLAAEQPK